MYRVVKQFVTLMEMIIVMILISLIIGVVAYNYKGVLDEGNAFKSNMGRKKLETILSTMVANDPQIEDQIESHWEKIIESSPLVQNAKSLSYDGWGEKYQVHLVDGHIVVTSRKLNEYIQKNPGSMIKNETQK